MDDVRISFIIPVYNAERYLEYTVESILRQNYQAIEVILVNDGSTDCSGNICRKIVNRDSRVKYIQQENKGVSSARNVGLKNAVGEYIWFIDSDDDLISGAIDIMMEVVNKQHSDIIIAGMVFHDEIRKKQTVKAVNYSFDFEGVKEFSNYYIELMNKNYISSLCNKLIKRNLLLENQIYLCENLSIYEDYCCAMEAIQAAEKVTCVPDLVYNYRLRGNGSLSHRYKKGMPDMLKIFIQYCEKFLVKMSENQKEVKQSISNLVVYVTYLCIKNEAKISGQKSAYQAIKNIVISQEVQMFVKYSQSDDMRFKIIKKLITFKAYRLLYYLCK